MPTHASKRVLALRELGGAIYDAMNSDCEYRAYTVALELDTALILTHWEYEHAPTDLEQKMLDLHLACDHSGAQNEVSDMIDWVDKMWPAPERRLNVKFLWDLTSGSVDDEGDSVPCPEWFKHPGHFPVYRR